MKNGETLQRKTETKLKIRSALIDLVKVKKLQDISITELCKAAGVNRTTFYNHYDTQYDVFEEAADEYLMNTAFLAKSHAENGEDFLQWLTKVLEYIKDNLEFSRLVVKMNNQELMEGFERQLPDFGALISGNPEAEAWQNDYRARFIEWGTVSIIIQWINNGCDVQPSQQAERIALTISSFCH